MCNSKGIRVVGRYGIAWIVELMVLVVTCNVVPEEDVCNVQVATDMPQQTCRQEQGQA